jgi:hypothetical protein
MIAALSVSGGAPALKLPHAKKFVILHPDLKYDSMVLR